MMSFMSDDVIDLPGSSIIYILGRPKTSSLINDGKIFKTWDAIILRTACRVNLEQRPLDSSQKCPKHIEVIFGGTSALTE